MDTKQATAAAVTVQYEVLVRRGRGALATAVKVRDFRTAAAAEKWAAKAKADGRIERVRSMTEVTPPGFAAALVAETPEGWQAEVGHGYNDGMQGWPSRDPACCHVVYMRQEPDGPAIAIVLNVRGARDKWELPRAVRGLVVEGHTTYDHRCFTRRGVDCESCALVAKPGCAHEYATLAALLAGERQRCLEAFGRSRTAVPVPGLPFTVQPEWFGKTAETLRKGGTVHLAPHGMGVGYTLRRGRPSRFGHAADAVLVEKLGVGPVAVDTFDHD